jgi:hypothetical protein
MWMTAELIFLILFHNRNLPRVISTGGGSASGRRSKNERMSS